MPDFSDVQSQMRNQMTAQVQDSELKESAQEMSEAAKQLNQTNVNQLQQTNAMVQSLQQTQVQIQNLVSNIQALTNHQRMQSLQPPEPPPRPPPPSQPGMMASFGQTAASVGREAWGITKFAGGMAAGAAANSAIQKVEAVRQRATALNQTYNPFNAQAQVGAAYTSGMSQTPGVLNVPNRGLFSSGYNSLGIMHNPTLSQNYSYGAYQTAQARNFGQNVSDVALGVPMGAASMVTAENAGYIGGGMAGQWLGGLAGGALGSALGPVGTVIGGAIGSTIGAGVGGSAGGAVGRVADIANPIKFGIGHVQRALSFGEQSNVGARHFLRGGGGTRRAGQWDLSQQAQAGIGVAETALKDLTFTGGDIEDMQQMFAESGLNLGVQNPQQYQANFEKRMEDAKQIMKIFNTSMEEAVQFMSQEFGTMGFDSGAKLTRFRTEMLAGAHLAGKTPQEMAQIAMQGSSAAAGMGLMATTGAKTAVSSAGLAGMSATLGGRGGRGVGTDLLSTVGGEEGLTQLLNRQNLRFRTGVGGTVMAMGGGGFGTDLMGAMGGMNLSGDNMMDFFANRHKRLSEGSPEEMQLQQYQMYSGLADEMGSLPGSREDKMKIIAQQMGGMSSAEAEAWIKSTKAMPEQMERRHQIKAQNLRDYKRDVMAEQFGIRGRFARFFRGEMEETGVLGLAQDAVVGTARLGERAANLSETAFDRFYGIEDRRSYTLEGVAKLTEMDNEAFIDKSSDKDQKIHRTRIKARRVFEENSETAEHIKDTLLSADPSTEEGMDTIKRAVQFAKEGKRAWIRRDVRMTQLPDGGPSPEEIITHMQEGGSDEEDINTAAEKLGVDVDKISSQQITSRDIAEDMRSSFFEEGYAEKQAGYRESFRRTATLATAGMYGDELAEAVIDKGGFDIGEVRNEDMMYAAGSSEWDELMTMTNELFKMRDHQATEAGQSDKYKRLKRRILSKYKDAPERVRKVFEKMVRSKGINISDGDMNLQGATTRMAGEHSKFGRDLDLKTGTELWENFESKKKGAKSKVLDAQTQDAIRTGLQQVTGLDEDNIQHLIGAGGGIDPEALREELASMGKFEKDKLKEMYQSGNKYQKWIARAAATAAEDPSKLTQSQLEDAAYAVAMSGASETEVLAGSGKMDKDMIGAKSAEHMASASDSLHKTAKILQNLESKGLF